MTDVQQPEWFRQMITGFLNHTVRSHVQSVKEAGTCAVCEGSEFKCYSDHNEDIRRKGICDYCQGTEPLG